MSRHAGTPTLASLAARCDELGDCLIWRGPYNNGTPFAHVHPDTFAHTDRPRHVSARWLTALLAGNAQAAAELEQGATKGFWRATCGTAGCVAPAHIALVSPLKHLRAIAFEAHESAVVSALRAERIARTRRMQSGKVDAATAAAAITDTRSAAAVAREIGVSKQAVSRWRRAAAKRITSGPWGQLLAR